MTAEEGYSVLKQSLDQIMKRVSVILLAFIVSAAACAEENPKSPAAANAGPTTADGKPLTQFGSGFVAYWAPEAHLIDELKAQSYRAFGANVGSEKLTFDDLVARGHIDPATNTFTSLPNGQPIRLGIIRGAARDYPQLYSGKYVITWEGDGDVGFSFGGPPQQKRVSANRLEGTFPASHDRWTGVSITRIGQSGVRNIRAFKASEEDALGAGRVFSTRWRDFVGRYKILRTMDINDTNASAIRSVDQIADETALVWAGDTKIIQPKSRVRGFPLRAQFALAAANNQSLWLNAPPLLGAPDIFDTPEYFSQLKVRDENGVEQNLMRDRAALHTPEIIASDEMAKYAERLVALLEETNYPEDQTFYLELGNEVWNFGGPFAKVTHYYWGITKGLRQKGEMRFGYGYLSAKLAHEFDKALQKAGRNQAWKMVIGTHTAYLERTRWSLDGVSKYLADQSLSKDAWMTRFGVSTTSYYFGGFQFRKGGALFGARNADEWRRKWLAALQRNPEDLSRRIEMHITEGADSVSGAQAWIINRRRAHRDIAASFGADFIGDYEGGSHDTLDRELKKIPEAVEFYRAFMRSEYAARIQKSVTDALVREFPDAIVADFWRIGVTNGAHDPWVEQIWDDPTPVTDVLDSYLRDAPAP